MAAAGSLGLTRRGRRLFLLRMKLSLKKNWGIWAALAASALAASASAAGTLNVYSQRHYEVDEQLNRLFTERTGIEVRVVNAQADQLMERLRSEGENSPADLLVTVDVARMQRAKAGGLLRPLESERLRQAVPASFRDAEGHWYAYTLRARVLVAAKGRVAPGEIERYEDIAAPEWRGRVLARSSSSPYNQALLASMVVARGEAAAERWARGVANNFARPPQGGDRDQIRAVAGGLADVCVANSYYLGMMLNSSDAEERAAAEKVFVVFPNQGEGERGAHANVGAAGLTRYASNEEEARAYLEFLLSPEAQRLIASGSYEFPMVEGVEPNATHAAWGDFRVDQATFSKLGAAQDRAVAIFDRVGWR